MTGRKIFTLSCAVVMAGLYCVRRLGGDSVYGAWLTQRGFVLICLVLIVAVCAWWIYEGMRGR